MTLSLVAPLATQSTHHRSNSTSNETATLANLQKIFLISILLRFF